MQHPPNLPPSAKALLAVTGFATTKVIHALIKTNAIEELRDNPKTLDELAERCQLNKDVLFRTLRYAISTGFLALTDEHYSLTDTGRCLLKGVPGSIALPTLFIGEKPWQESWDNLIYSLQTGKVAFDKAMGSPFFDYLAQHPEYGEPFDQWMTITSEMTATAIVNAYDFSPFKTVCDVGGGYGYLLKAVLSANPNLKGILQDMESVVSKHILGDDMKDRVEVVAGDFFESVPSADCLLMKYILHDWNDENCLKILASCKKAIPEGGKLLIVEQIVDPASNPLTLFYDLHMQVVLGGKERTQDEFTDLLGKAGFKISQIVPTQSPVKIIEATVA